jgi:hypothetical protein
MPRLPAAGAGRKADPLIIFSISRKPRGREASLNGLHEDGYPGDYQGGKKRKPLTDLVRQGRWETGGAFIMAAENSDRYREKESATFGQSVLPLNGDIEGFILIWCRMGTVVPFS